MEKEMHQQFEIGQQVVIDKDLGSGGGVVEVVYQTPCRLFTTVKDESETWDVMTYRLSYLTTPIPGL